jgi:hypothetical protein
MLLISNSLHTSPLKYWQVPPIRHWARSIRQWLSIACVWSLVWMLFILWIELGIFRHSVNRCEWPTDKEWSVSVSE